MVTDPPIASVYFMLIHAADPIRKGSGCAVVMIGEATAATATVDDARQQSLTGTPQVCRSVVGKHGARSLTSLSQS